jgi:hypothetical protein
MGLIDWRLCVKIVSLVKAMDESSSTAFDGLKIQEIVHFPHMYKHSKHVAPNFSSYSSVPVLRKHKAPTHAFEPVLIISMAQCRTNSVSLLKSQYFHAGLSRELFLNLHPPTAPYNHRHNLSSLPGIPRRSKQALLLQLEPGAQTPLRAVFCPTGLYRFRRVRGA